MFGFNSTKSAKNPAPKNDVDFSIPAFDNVTEEELLQDAELLKEFNELMGENSTEEKVIVEVTKAANVTASIRIENEHEVDNIALTENDLEDPSLLAELHALNVSNDGPEDVPNAEKISETKKDVEKHRVVSEETEEEELMPLESMLKSTDPKTLEQFINLKRLKAIEAKNKRELSEARVALNEVKILKRHLEGILSKDDKESKIDSPLSIAKQRLSEYKNAALTAKKSNDLVRAKDFMLTIKKVESMIQSSQSGITVDWSQLPPEPSSLHQREQQLSKSMTASSNSYNVANGSGKDTLIKVFEKQIAQATELGRKYSFQGELDKSKLLEKVFSKLNDDLHVLKSVEAYSCKNVDLEFLLQDLNHDVPLNEVNIGIVRGLGLNSLDGTLGSDLNTFVKWDFGWPTSEKPYHNMSKGETGKDKGINPQWNMSKFIPIERTKGFMRHCERKKFVLDVYHYKGLLWGQSFVGHAEVKLSDFLEKSEIHTVVELMDQSNRKRLQGKIEVKLQLREPLLKKIAIVKKERWILLNTFDDSILNPFRPASQMNKKQDIQPKRTSSDNSAKLEAPLKKEADMKTLRTQSPVGDSSIVKSPVSESLEDTEQLIDTFSRIDLIASNNVLEAELAELKAQKYPDKSKEEERLEKVGQIELRLKILVIQVQTGQLTMETYLESVRQSIDQNKSLALSFKRAGLIDYAKKCLKRIKIMESELSDV